MTNTNYFALIIPQLFNATKYLRSIIKQPYNYSGYPSLYFDLQNPLEVIY